MNNLKDDRRVAAITDSPPIQRGSGDVGAKPTYGNRVGLRSTTYHLLPKGRGSSHSTPPR